MPILVVSCTTIPTTINTKDEKFFKTLGARVAQANVPPLTEEKIAAKVNAVHAARTSSGAADH